MCYLVRSLSDLHSVNSDEGHSIVVETSVKDLLRTSFVGMEVTLIARSYIIKLLSIR